MSSIYSSASMHMFRVGTEYYITARAAARGGLMAVAGNLFHHAIEMLLKGEFSKSVPLDRIKKQFSHFLIKIWNEFKSLHPDADLSSFDSLIADLDGFEQIRYPDGYIVHGAILAIGWGDAGIKHYQGPEVPVYSLDVNQIDELVDRLFSLCRINPPGYLAYLNPNAIECLRHWNKMYDNWNLPMPAPIEHLESAARAG